MVASVWIAINGRRHESASDPDARSLDSPARILSRKRFGFMHALPLWAGPVKDACGSQPISFGDYGIPYLTGKA